MRGREFTCLRCGRCCKAGLLIPLTLSDFQEWFVNRCYLPIILSIRESNYVTDEAGIEYVYTIISSRHSTYRYIKEIYSSYGLKLPDEGCSLFNSTYNTCRIYKMRPLVCRIFPFDVNLKISEWAQENCEAVLQGFTQPNREIIYLTHRYALDVERTYSSREILDKIERIRREVIEKVLKKFIKQLADFEEVKYLLLKNVEYTTW